MNGTKTNKADPTIITFMPSGMTITLPGSIESLAAKFSSGMMGSAELMHLAACLELCRDPGGSSLRSVHTSDEPQPSWHWQ